MLEINDHLSLHVLGFIYIFTDTSSIHSTYALSIVIISDCDDDDNDHDHNDDDDDHGDHDDNDHVC